MSELATALRGVRRPGSIVAGLLLIAAASACGGSTTAGTATGVAGGAPAPTSTPNATMAGPTTFAAWAERQGFAGGSGIAEVQKGAHWLSANVGAPDRDTWAAWWNETADGLTFWLDIHPATPCWAGYHDAARKGLARIEADFVPIRTAVAAGKLVPGDAAADMVQAADELVALQPEAGCT